jgi:hypothetical protein
MAASSGRRPRSRAAFHRRAPRADSWRAVLLSPPPVILERMWERRRSQGMWEEGTSPTWPRPCKRATWPCPSDDDDDGGGDCVEAAAAVA